MKASPARKKRGDRRAKQPVTPDPSPQKSSEPPRQPGHFPGLPLLLVCFSLSGAAGLIYQVAWGNALGLIFGHTAYAVATVLAVFMGGLTAGSAWLGKWSENSRRPVTAYGWLEIGIAGEFWALSESRSGTHCGRTRTLCVERAKLFTAKTFGVRGGGKMNFCLMISTLNREIR